MANTTFFNSSDLDAQGHALSCEYCFDVLIDQCLFTNLTAKSGSALKFMESANVSVLNSTFARNQATDFGGAIYLIKPTYTKIQNCTFTNNSAASKESIRADKKVSAGAIFYECKQPMLGKCDVELLNNIFTNNTALYAGGALRAVNQNFTVSAKTPKRCLSDTIIESNTYTNNSAFYGDNFASRPDSLQFSIYDPQNDDSNLNMTTRHLNIAPGQSFQLTVSIHDTEGRLYSIAHGIEGRIELVHAEKLHPNSLIQANKVVSNYGVFSFNNLNIKIPTESEAQVVFKILDLETFTNPVSFIDVPVNMTVYARNCHSGESYSEALACVPCVEPFYSYEILNSNNACKSCPDEAYCYGKNYTAPRKGYWRSSPRSDMFMKCKNEEACLAGNRDNPLGICQNGYQGILCAECTHGNYKIDEFTCATCARKVSTIVFHVLYGISLVAIISLLVRSALKGRGRLNLGQCFTKIIVNHYQMLIILSIIEFKLPERVKDIIAFQNKVASIPLRVFSLDCLLMQTMIGKDSKVRLNYVLSALFCALPYAFAILTLLFWQIVGRTCRKSVPRQLLISQQWATFYIVTLLFYPSLTRVVVEGFNCIQIEDVGRLYKDLTQVCWTGSHLTAVKWMYAPTLVIWVIGFPIGTLIMIYRDKAKLSKQINENPVLTDEERFQLDQIFEVKWGFLLSGFNEKHYYWEVVMMLQKTILVVLTVLFSPLSASLQALLMVFVLVVFLALQMMYQPFVDQKLNEIQKFSIFVLIGVIYIGLYYFQQDPIFKDGNPYVKWLAFILILAPTLIFLGIFVFTVRLEVKKALKSIPALAQLLLLSTRKEVVDAEPESESKASEQQGSQEVEPDLQITKYVEPIGLRTLQMHGNLYQESESLQPIQSQSESAESFRNSEESQSMPDKSDTTADFSEMQFRVKYVASREKESAIDPDLFLVSQRRQQFVQDPIEEATVEDSIDDINDIDDSGANRASSHLHPDLASSHLHADHLSSQAHSNHASGHLHVSQTSSHLHSNHGGSHIILKKVESYLQIKPEAHTHSPRSLSGETKSLKTESDIISEKSETSEEIITTTFKPKPNKQDLISKPLQLKSVLDDASSKGSQKPAPKQRHSPQMLFHDIISRQQRASLLDSDNGLNNMRKQSESDKNSSAQVSDDEPDNISYQSNQEQRRSVLQDTAVQFFSQQRGRMTSDDRGQIQNRLLRMMPNELENITEGLGTSQSASVQTSEQQSDSARKRKQPSQMKSEINKNQRMSSSLFVPQGRSWNQARNQIISSRNPMVQQRVLTSESSEEEQKLPAPNVRVLTLGDNYRSQIQETVQRTDKESRESEYETQQQPKRRTSVKFQDNSFGMDSSDISFDLL